MLNLNLKLQSTVLKSQVKAIDLELRELEARQAAEHLAIVKVSARFDTVSITSSHPFTKHPGSLIFHRPSSSPTRTPWTHCCSSSGWAKKWPCLVVTSSRNTPSAKRSTAPFRTTWSVSARSVAFVLLLRLYAPQLRAHILFRQARSKLDHFAALNKRFSAHLRRCPPATFLKMGSVYREVASTEKRINAYVEALRKEELPEISCAKDLEG